MSFKTKCTRQICLFVGCCFFIITHPGKYISDYTCHDTYFSHICFDIRFVNRRKLNDIQQKEHVYEDLPKRPEGKSPYEDLVTAPSSGNDNKGQPYQNVYDNDVKMDELPPTPKELNSDYEETRHM